MAFKGDLSALNDHLLTRSYVGGYQLSPADEATFKSMDGCPDKSSYPHASRWYLHIAAVLGLRVVASSSAPAAASTAKKAAKKPAKDDDDDDDDDLFGDDDDDDEPKVDPKEAAKKRAEAAKKAKAANKKVERSQLVIDVKPWDTDTDLLDLKNKIYDLTIDGLTWGEGHKLEEVAFGIKKLVISCVIIDDKVMTDDITDAIANFEDHVQSVDIAAFNKL